MESGNISTGDIIIQCKKQAFHEAKKYRLGLVLLTDGSKLHHGNVGAAVCWRDKRLGQWKDKSVFLGKVKEILGAELWAILEALCIAEKETQEAENTPVKSFCDSQKALKAIEQPYTPQGNWFLRSLIYQKTQKLQDNGCVITIRWIPSHSGLSKK